MWWCGTGTYVPGCDGEVVEEEVEGRGGDVEAEEGATVAEPHLDRRVDRHHPRGHARAVRAALDVVRLEHHALQNTVCIRTSTCEKNQSIRCRRRTTARKVSEFAISAAEHANIRGGFILSSEGNDAPIIALIARLKMWKLEWKVQLLSCLQMERGVLIEEVKISFDTA